YCTWKLMETPLGGVSGGSPQFGTNQLQGLTRSFEGMPFTFYIHNDRNTFTDNLHKDSGTPYADEVSRLYYASVGLFRRNRLFR
ncbi:hypothetical protein Q2330_26730, partial [Escherichia coli]|nr:hypothetical protein [Escherichia coli]